MKTPVVNERPCNCSTESQSTSLVHVLQKFIFRNSSLTTENKFKNNINRTYWQEKEHFKCFLGIHKGR